MHRIELFHQLYAKKFSNNFLKKSIFGLFFQKQQKLNASEKMKNFSVFQFFGDVEI